MRVERSADALLIIDALVLLHGVNGEIYFSERALSGESSLRVERNGSSPPCGQPADRRRRTVAARPTSPLDLSAGPRALSLPGAPRGRNSSVTQVTLLFSRAAFRFRWGELARGRGLNHSEPLVSPEQPLLR